MKHSLLLLPLLACLAACGSDADPKLAEAEAAKQAVPEVGELPLDSGGLPQFRAGLWEIRTGQREAAETERVCRGPGVEPEVRELLTGPAGPGCEKTRSSAGGGLKVSMRCTRPGAQIEVSVNLTGSETRYAMTMETAVTSPDGSRAAETVTADARWISDCPAGMSPGDVAE